MFLHVGFGMPRTWSYAARWESGEGARHVKDFGKPVVEGSICVGVSRDCIAADPR